MSTALTFKLPTRLLYGLCVGLSLSAHAQSKWSLQGTAGMNVSFNQLYSTPALPEDKILALDRASRAHGLFLEYRFRPRLAWRAGFMRTNSVTGFRTNYIANTYPNGHVQYSGGKSKISGMNTWYHLGMVAYARPQTERFNFFAGLDIAYAPVPDRYSPATGSNARSLDPNNPAIETLTYRMDHRELVRANWGANLRAGMVLCLNDRHSLALEASYLHTFRQMFAQTSSVFVFNTRPYDVRITNRGNYAALLLSYRRSILRNYRFKPSLGKQVFLSVTGYNTLDIWPQQRGFVNVKAGYFLRKNFLVGAEYFQLTVIHNRFRSLRAEGAAGLFTRWYPTQGRVSPYLELHGGIGDGRVEPDYDGIDNYNDPIHSYQLRSVGATMGADVTLNHHLRLTTGVRVSHQSSAPGLVNTYHPFVGVSVNW